MNEAKKREYKVVDVHTQLQMEGRMAAVNEAAKEGWVIVNIVPRGDYNSTHCVYMERVTPVDNN